MTCETDHAHAGQTWVAFKRARHLEAVPVRQRDVRQDDVRNFVRRVFQGNQGRAQRYDAEAVVSQEPRVPDRAATSSSTRSTNLRVSRFAVDGLALGEAAPPAVGLVNRAAGFFDCFDTRGRAFLGVRRLVRFFTEWRAAMRCPLAAASFASRVYTPTVQPLVKHRTGQQLSGSSRLYACNRPKSSGRFF
jgi:hypothetical protein